MTTAHVDPNDTLPPPPSLPPPPPLSPDDRTRLDLDRAASTYATWCARLAHRGHTVDDLVVIAFEYLWFSAVIATRDEVEAKYPTVAAALRRETRTRGRLSVVVVHDDGNLEVRDMSVPFVDAGAPSEPTKLSAEQQKRVRDRIDHARRVGVPFKPWMFDHPMDDLCALVDPWGGGAFRVDAVHDILRSRPHLAPLVQEASLSREHGKICVLVDAFEDIEPSVTWRSPEWFGVSRLDWSPPSFIL
ncbi:MAG TPA: hypothetical protein VGH28_29965 [Polyangiaceae bacterium]|jgi:hypothetical protein